MKTKISKAVKVLSVASFVLSAHFAKAEEQTEVQAIEAKGTQIAAQVKEGIDTAAQAVSESPIVTTAVETTQKIGEQLKEAGISPEAAKAAIVDIEERAKEVGMSVEEYLGTRAYYKAEQLGTKATLTVAELLAKMNPEEIKQSIQELSLDEKVEAAKEKATEMYDSAKSKFSSWIDAGKEKISETVNSLKTEK